MHNFESSDEDRFVEVRQKDVVLLSFLPFGLPLVLQRHFMHPISAVNLTMITCVQVAAISSGLNYGLRGNLGWMGGARGIQKPLTRSSGKMSNLALQFSQNGVVSARYLIFG